MSYADTYGVYSCVVFGHIEIRALNKGMEGATSKVNLLKNGWVRKTLKRKEKKKATPVARQLELQRWSAAILTPKHGFRILFTPEARASNAANSYEMERIDDSNPITKIEDAALEAELESYFRLAKEAGIYPSDFELYKQSDTRIALLDFDKFGTIQGRMVNFPYRHSVSLNTVPQESLYSEAFASRLQGIMKGGGRRKTRRHRHT